ncbi:hypothetical protein OPT61_g820 [Boeremia exigua]|uniref:Uncharacterized protein n=1 Tax=Boeremia exigua TaxID=749465 RepID=A0ACC2ISQ2_9PLEO|nr:hypothetical protein OPT61_g820 [Boeremia exigua]
MASEGPAEGTAEGLSTAEFALLIVAGIISGSLFLWSSYHLIQIHLVPYWSRPQIWTLTPLPRQQDEGQVGDDTTSSSAIPLQEIAIHSSSRQSTSQQARYLSTFLELPTEIRMQIYSYLLPDNEPTAVSRALRGTCHKVNHEVKDEVRRTFERHMSLLQRFASEGTPFVTFSYSTETYHVDILFELPSVPLQQSLSPFVSPFGLDRIPIAMDMVLLQFVVQLPRDTRSLTVTLKPHEQQQSNQVFETYMNDFWTVLYENTVEDLKANCISDGTIDLRRITVLCARPVTMALQVRYRQFHCILNWINVTGITFWSAQVNRLQSDVVLDSSQWHSKIVHAVLRRLRPTVQMYFRSRQD